MRRRSAPRPALLTKRSGCGRLSSFFFSSRRRHTRLQGDWSSDVCSSDLSILIKDGKITEVSQSINAPNDAQVIDAAGQFVMPGIIDCHSHIAAESINEGRDRKSVV